MSGDSKIITAIVLAAGSSSRMSGTDKQLVTLRGYPLFIHSLRILENSDLVGAVCVMFSESNIAPGKEAITVAGLTKVVSTVTGGARRQDSVRAGLDALETVGTQSEWLLIHDGARPFIDESMISRGLDAARKTGAAVAAVSLKDTVKQVDGETVVATPDRSSLRLVQTPQIFSASMLHA